MSKKTVTFSKTIEVMVDASDDLEALRTALDAPGLKAAFDDAQTIFSVEDWPDSDTPVGIIIRPRLMEVV
jgi:hypothetical protein